MAYGYVQSCLLYIPTVYGGPNQLTAVQQSIHRLPHQFHGNRFRALLPREALCICDQ
jgi:hypothetical protein